MKSKKDVIRDVVKPASISPRSSFTDPNEPWSAKANVAENITSVRSNLLQQFYKSKGWNVNYISKNKKVSQSKTGDFIKWKRDHGIYEEFDLDEARMSAAVRMQRAIEAQRAKSDASRARTPSSIPKKEEPKKDVAETFRPMDEPRYDLSIAARQKRADSAAKAKKEEPKKEQPKKQGVAEAKDEGEYDYEGAMAKTQLQTICRNAEELKDMLKDDENLPEWVQAKITKAEDYISTSLDYLKSTDELEEEFSLDEALSKNSTAYNFIHDFVHSDNPKFDGKSKAQRMQMALAAYYAMQKRSRTKNEEVKDEYARKVDEYLKKKYAKENLGDPQAATQSPADGANGGEEVAPRKTTKKIVKEFYALARKVQEDMYDWEKDDKAAKPHGKKPSVKKCDGVENIGDNKPNARLILKGGKTLTGEPRDTVEIDPMMNNRSKLPDHKSMDKIKQKPQEQ